MTENRILTGFRFDVSLMAEAPGNGALIDARAGFQEVSGLEVEMDVSELIEGGRNDGAVRRPGRAKHATIVLKRGMFLPGTTEENGKPRADTALWRWIQNCLAGELPVRRCKGLIDLKTTASADSGPVPVASWTFERGLPVKVKGPDLNARTGEIAIEELHIAHEGLRLELGGGT